MQTIAVRSDSIGRSVRTIIFGDLEEEKENKIEQYKNVVSGRVKVILHPLYGSFTRSVIVTIYNRKLVTFGATMQKGFHEEVQLKSK